MADYGLAGVAGKNLALSPASSDLGIGDQLRQQLSDEQEERRKKLLQLGGGVGNFLGGQASRDLFGSMR